MSILKVARMGHPVLRAPARMLERREIAQPSIQKLIDDMIETMHEYHGIGLAAPQVHACLHLFVAAIDPAREDDAEEPEVEPIVLINPVVTPVGSAVVEDWEGCLSIPDVRGLVPRSREITVTAMDRTGSRVETHARELPARVIQHETDHLNGVLFLDRMRSFDSLTFLDEYARYWRKSTAE
jgi:peptide deformylase